MVIYNTRIRVVLKVNVISFYLTFAILRIVSLISLVSCPPRCKTSSGREIQVSSLGSSIVGFRLPVRRARAHCFGRVVRANW